MKRPYVICLMLSTVNGKCSGSFYKLPGVDAACEANAAARSFYDCGSILYGSRTMTESYGTYTPADAKEAGDGAFPRTDYLARSEVKDYMISIDPAGTVRLPDKYIVRNGRPKAHVIEVLSEKVSNDYLAYLRSLDISYIFGGRETLDLSLVLHKLWKYFQIEKLLIAGGGIVNQTFLASGLIDEISLVVAPACAGEASAVSVFEPSPFAPNSDPVPLRLLECRTMDGGSVWLRYAPENVHDIS